MWSIRGQVSELVSEGHRNAPDYPIAFVWEEVEIITQRKNQMLASEATLMHSAINTAVAAFGKDGGKKANTVFRKLVSKLFGEVPKEDELPPLAEAPGVEFRGK